MPATRACLCAVALLAATARAEDFTVKLTIQVDERRREAVLVTVREAKGAQAAGRFRQLVNSKFFDGCAIFRVIPGVVLQFGLSSNRTLQAQWDAQPLSDEAVAHPDWNIRGSVAFVASDTSPRGTQLIINLDDNPNLDDKGYVPIGRVVFGMPTLASVYSGYRDRPQQAEIRKRGGEYLQSEFPRLSRIVSVRQVAFVEEPLVMSKNFTGLLITVGMVLAAALCCGLRRRVGPLVESRSKARNIFSIGSDRLSGAQDQDDDDLYENDEEVGKQLSKRSSS